MSETFIVRLFVGAREPAAPSGALGWSDGQVHGVVLRVATGGQIPFRDDTSLIAALHRLADIEVPASVARDEPAASDGHGPV